MQFKVVPFEHARALLEQGRDARAFPAAVCEVGTASGPVWTEAFGRLTYDAGAEETATDTAFDLASLTKVIATTSIAIALVRRNALSVDTLVADLVRGWRGADREQVRIRHLLDHSSGLPANSSVLDVAGGRDRALASICAAPLERPVGVSSVYSDVGFMLLGFLLEGLDGRGLDMQWCDLWEGRPDLESPREWLAYTPEPGKRPFIAPTEFNAARGGVIQGVVHDENAALLGGVAAHAGLFGAASAVGVFAASVLRSFHQPTWLATPELMRTFATRCSVPGSSRALGWDTMQPTSSCGALMSPTAIGHTGFTGTSLWIDWERDVYVVLLTNRVHPTRINERFLPYRALFHDAVMTALSEPAAQPPPRPRPPV